MDRVTGTADVVVFADVFSMTLVTPLASTMTSLADIATSELSIVTSSEEIATSCGFIRTSPEAFIVTLPITTFVGAITTSEAFIETLSGDIFTSFGFIRISPDGLIVTLVVSIVTSFATIVKFDSSTITPEDITLASEDIFAPEILPLFISEGIVGVSDEMQTSSIQPAPAFFG